MKQVILFMTVMVMLLSACNSGNNDYKETATGNTDTGYKGTEDDQSLTDTTQTAQFLSVEATGGNPDWDKKIIRTANLQLELKDYKTYNQKIHSGLKPYGAYIASEEQIQDASRIVNSVTIKVPVEQFDNFVQSLVITDDKVLQLKISSQDVTGEVVDTKSRIESKKLVRDSYLQMLRQAKSRKEILEVQGEVNAIQENIEAAADRVSYLAHQSAYSTVNLEYFQYLSGATTDHKSSYGIRIKEGFLSGIEVIGSIILVLVNIWPVLLAVIFALLIWRRKTKLVKP